MTESPNTKGTSTEKGTFTAVFYYECPKGHRIRKIFSVGGDKPNPPQKIVCDKCPTDSGIYATFKDSSRSDTNHIDN